MIVNKDDGCADKNYYENALNIFNIEIDGIVHEDRKIIIFKTNFS